MCIYIICVEGCQSDDQNTRAASLAAVMNNGLISHAAHCTLHNAQGFVLWGKLLFCASPLHCCSGSIFLPIPVLELTNRLSSGSGSGSRADLNHLPVPGSVLYEFFARFQFLALLSVQILAFSVDSLMYVQKKHIYQYFFY